MIKTLKMVLIVLGVILGLNLLVILGHWASNVIYDMDVQRHTMQTWVVTTGIDLTNCTSYFDGCNNCSVKNGKADACTLMYCETPSEPKCLQYATGKEKTTTEPTKNVGMANPASVNCTEKWWTLEILEWTGGQYGMCTFDNGKQCEERAFFRGECSK